ncbi:MAG TPA: methyltransferase domain-containing protein [Elusimicrobiota bacterium]|jgi:SAM-dependent methyltransferase|nr:methyltransferase domain-containing protein [Elusimicrobiota bacterium]
MRLSLLPLLACPVCGGALKFGALDRYPRHEENVESGALACASCRRDYPIRDGIPRLRPPEAVPADAAKTRESFGWEWLRYPGSRPVDEPTFLEETMLPREAFAGKLVLDAGCGMGRYSAVALALGAEVVAVDMSDSLIRVAEAARSNPKLHPVEGDLLRPPLQKGIFDVAYSQGVLHHTSNTQAAFKAVAALVKPGGLLSVWLYGKAGRFADFATNPIRPGREWIVARRRLAWWVVLIRHLFSDLVRVFTTRLPVPVTYALCYPLTVLGAVPGLKYLTFSVDPDFQARLIENFDWVSPPYQWHHTKEELTGWYAEEGFTVLMVLPHGLVPKPGALGKKRAA